MRSLAMNLALGGLAGLLGGGVCFGIGFVIVRIVGVPEGAYWGVGLEPWNLPGTILGVIVFAGIIFVASRKG